MSKLRTDSWAAALTEDQQWQLYYKSQRASWNEAAAWAVKEFGLERMPCRSGFYKWRAAMMEDEHRHSMEQGIMARQWVRESAEANTLKSEESRKALEQEAVTLGLMTKDWKTANGLLRTTLAIRDREIAAAKLELEQAAQRTRDEQLRLAREKFEFDAAKTAMAKAAEIKSISADDTLAADEKIARVRAALFGVDSTQRRREAEDAE